MIMHQISLYIENVKQITYTLNFDELVKTIFSRNDAKNAKKILFNINRLPLRSLRLCVRF